MSSSLGSCIIVGGGPGGIQVAKTIVGGLKRGESLKITIVDRQNYMDWSLASPRMLVDPDSISNQGFGMPLDKVVEFVNAKSSNITFVQGAVTKIGAKTVELADGTTLEADSIVLAMGGQYASGALWKPLPEHTTIDKRKAAFVALKEKVSKAKSIVIAGAGPAGVEIAGEIQAAFPDTKVTMVGTLLPNSPPSLQTRMKTALEGLGVVVMEGRVDQKEPTNGKVTLRDGSTIENVDLILNAAGFTYKGKDLASGALTQDVTERGQFACRNTLQLASVDTVFCCGDILAVPPGKYADVKGLNHANETGAAVGKNVVALLRQKPLADYKWSSTPVNKPMMTALGPNVAVGYMGIFNFMENFMARSLKCKDYYMSLMGSQYGKGKTW